MDGREQPFTRDKTADTYALALIQNTIAFHLEESAKYVHNEVWEDE